jgi:transcriptional regulator PpsR
MRHTNSSRHVGTYPLPGSTIAPSPGVNLIQPDVRLTLDREGIIRAATLGGSVAGQSIDRWVGSHWASTLHAAAEPAIRRIIDAALGGRLDGYCQVNQRFPSGLELPIEYTTVPAGDGSGVIAIGRNLQLVKDLEARVVHAQQQNANDHLKLHEVETRYRLLLEGSNDAVLLLDPASTRVIEANAAAMAALGLTAAPQGQQIDFRGGLQPRDQQAFEAMLAMVRQTSTAPGIVLHLGPDQAPWFVRATLTTSSLETVFMLRLSRAGTGPPTASAGPDVAVARGYDAIVSSWPQAFVITGREGVLRRVNDAFLDLVQLSSPHLAEGTSIGRWLTLPGANLAVLLAQLDRHGTIRAFRTTVHGELGIKTDVEITAARLREHGGIIGVMLTDVSRRSAVANGTVKQIVELLTGTPGHTTLPQLTKDAVGLIEKHYVTTALELTGGNRTAAAELLGVSRQSLYSKLARYDFGDDLDSDEIA